MNVRLSDGWKATTLGDVCEVNPPRPNLSDLPGDTSVMFVPMAAVDELTGTVQRPEQRLLKDVQSKSYRTFRSRDVIFAKITPCMENGKSAIVPDSENEIGFGSTEFHVLRPTIEVQPGFVWHWVRQERFRRDAAEVMTGSVGQLRVPARFLEEFPITLPPPETQDQIVEALNSVTASEHSAKRRLAAAREAVEHFRQSVLAAACSGKLTVDWRRDNPDSPPVDQALVQMAARRVRKRAEVEGASDLAPPELPDSYVLSTVGAAAVLLEYGTSQRAEASTDGMTMLRMGNIQEGRLDLTDLKYCRVDHEVRKLVLMDGDLLFNRTNSPELVGKSAVFHEVEPMTFASYLIRVRFAPDVALPDFVNYWINSAWGRLWARHVKTDGVSQSNINGTKLGAMSLPLPPIREQHEIVRRAEHLLAAGTTISQRIEAASKLTNQTAQAVVGKALRGNVVPIESELA